MAENKLYHTVIYSVKAQCDLLSHEGDMKFNAGLYNLSWLPP